MLTQPLQVWLGTGRYRESGLKGLRKARCSVYLLYWYKITNTDAKGAARGGMHDAPVPVVRCCGSYGNYGHPPSPRRQSSAAWPWSDPHSRTSAGEVKVA